ncbi:hypothetical protein BD309DRAFT_388149 [Dichomitus squalens]|uniref:Uncharacterized protein n=1 Tax=Dichomitus squalens TaxID=114155 RepID=A0A4V2K988_9APHY|nr:uncharacterized protein DICSQDRAFT_152948 [Dichomitus squalens LYAD-421 SS1]EJF64720.1 hypothetical protein DICSQDRAFT_152948 [Dichomitus squalens LYAD-421 SS1]TBU50452.1 hypothetical protein BD309DRAFT_388149 [Dichomitus squalens]TBU62988.1 hypothetical protein BD310DRAFT_662778 [Dichomitus squalens]
MGPYVKATASVHCQLELTLGIDARASRDPDGPASPATVLRISRRRSVYFAPTQRPQYSGVRGLTVETRRRTIDDVQQSYHCSRGARTDTICTRDPAQSPGSRPWCACAGKAERSGLGRRAMFTQLPQLKPVRKLQRRTGQRRALSLALRLRFLESGFHGATFALQCADVCYSRRVP